MTHGRRAKQGHRALLSRGVAALFGGYAVASLTSGLLAILLHSLWRISRVDAVLTATMLGLLVHAGAALAVFHARSAARAWRGLFVIAAPLAAALLLFGPWI